MDWARAAGTFALAMATTACSTPGISYEARLPAGHVEASSYRTVGVEGFRGPQGGWFAAQFEQMLAGATLDGRPWFTVSAYGAGPHAAGGYSGFVSIDDVDVHDWTRVERKCVEWDGLFDCETRADVEQYCEEIEIDVSATIRLSDRQSGRLVLVESYHGDASEQECWDIGIVGRAHHRKRRHQGLWRDHVYGTGWRGGATPELVREALSETLADIRRDIAPRNIREKAPLLAEAIEAEAGADLRFREGVEAAQAGDFVASCALWEALLADYPSAPGVRHNAGACAEAAGEYARAQTLYGEAMAAMDVYPNAQTGMERIKGALARISSRRSGEALLENLTGEAARVPVPAPDPDDASRS